jgi:RNA polymerase sigma-70 factor (ECF subfamily)
MIRKARALDDDQAPTLSRQTTPASILETDEELAHRAGADEQAFGELYRRRVDAIYRFHLIRTGNVDDAEDLTSQTFLAALQSISKYRGQGSFCGWLFGIASHKLADHYRRRAAEEPLDALHEVIDSQPSPEELAAVKLELGLLARALKVLDADQAEAFSLRVLGELSAADVGRIMGKSEAAVKMLVHRGLRNLQQRLVFTMEGSS